MFTVAHKTTTPTEKKLKKEKPNEINNIESNKKINKDQQEKRPKITSNIFTSKISVNQQVNHTKINTLPNPTFQSYSMSTNSMKPHKIKFKVSVCRSSENEKTEQPLQQKTNSSISTKNINNLENNPNSHQNNCSNLLQNSNNITSPFVTFSIFNKKTFTTISQNNSQNSSCVNANSTNASSPVNSSNINSNILNFSNKKSSDSISNPMNLSLQLTRASTANSVTFSVNNKIKSDNINSNYNKSYNSKENLIDSNTNYFINGNFDSSNDNLLNENQINSPKDIINKDLFNTNSQISQVCYDISNMNFNSNSKTISSSSSNSNSFYQGLNEITKQSNGGFSKSIKDGFSSNNLLNKNYDRKKLGKKLKEIKIKHKRLSKEGNYNCGRWQPEEHQRFIEAIMKFGNEWKQVQKHVGTRSSTQARSHAQKFFVKIKKANVLQFNIDLSKNSIKTLHELANNLNTDEYFNAIKALNCVAFERKNNNLNQNHGKRKTKKEDFNSNDSNNFYFSDLANGTFNLMNNNEDNLINSLNCNEQNFIFGNYDTKQNKKNYNSNNINNNIYNYNNTFNFSNIKIIQNEFEESKKNNFNTFNYPGQCFSNFEFKSDNNFIIINNNINNYNYNINYNNTQGFNSNSQNNNNFNFFKNEQTYKKRNRFTSFEGIFPQLEKDTWFPIDKKMMDENEMINSFCKNIKYDDFINEDLENLIFMTNSNSENCSKDQNFLNKKRTKSEKDYFTKNKQNDGIKIIVDKDVEDIFKFLDVDQKE